MAADDDVAKAITALRAAYPRQAITAKQFREMVDLWTEILEDVPGEVLMVAVKAWISSDSPWMPSVGQLRQAAIDLSPGTGALKTAGDAWEEVRRALSRGEHGYRKGQYQWSSELVERAFNGVGGWHYFNQALIDSVMADRAHFMRIYNDLLEREDKARREPPVVAVYRRALLGGGAAEHRSERPRTIPVDVEEFKRLAATQEGPEVQAAAGSGGEVDAERAQPNEITKVIGDLAAQQQMPGWPGRARASARQPEREEQDAQH